ncbi:MAG: uncharacterized protein QG559_204, partial [Campylobacterota bacterium]|nr:uncharacterized protein [Campylobacterota bacterium]
MLKYIVLLFLALLSVEANEALEAFKNKDYARAFKLYEKSAQDGDAQSQSALSYLYANGLGVQKDAKKSFEWLKKAADANYSPAQYDLGMNYLTGSNIEKDSKKAFEYLDK